MSQDVLLHAAITNMLAQEAYFFAATANFLLPARDKKQNVPEPLIHKIARTYYFSQCSISRIPLYARGTVIVRQGFIFVRCHGVTPSLMRVNSALRCSRESCSVICASRAAQHFSIGSGVTGKLQPSPLDEGAVYH
jgi:hypothetical protein